MRHIFSVNVAKKYGMDCAVMLENLYFWISKNKANNRHCHDGKYWTYNSVKAFEELFPYWTYNQVRRILKKLEDEELIEKGNFNQSTYDRTAWYTLTTNAFAFFDSSMCVKPQMEDDENTNRSGQNNKPIPDVNTDGKPDDKPNTPIPPEGDSGDLPKPDDADQGAKPVKPEKPKKEPKPDTYSEKFEQWWSIYPRKTAKGTAWNRWKKDKLESRAEELIKKITQQVAMQYAFTETRYIPNASTYLNQKRYDDEIENKGVGNGVTTNSNGYQKESTMERARREQREFIEQLDSQSDQGVNQNLGVHDGELC